MTESVASRRLGQKVEGMLNTIDQSLGVLERDYVSGTNNGTSMYVRLV